MLRSFAKWCRSNLKHSNIHGGSPTSLHLALLDASLNLIWVRSGPLKCSELQMIHKDFYSEHQLTVKISCIQEKIGERWVRLKQIIHTLSSSVPLGLLFRACLNLHKIQRQPPFLPVHALLPSSQPPSSPKPKHGGTKAHVRSSANTETTDETTWREWKCDCRPQ